MSDTKVRGKKLADTTYADVIEWAKVEYLGEYVDSIRSYCTPQVQAFSKLIYIAAYLNEGWVRDANDLNQRRYAIAYMPKGFLPLEESLETYGLAAFPSYALTLKAIELMGADLYVLFNISNT